MRSRTLIGVMIPLLLAASFELAAQTPAPPAGAAPAAAPAGGAAAPAAAPAATTAGAPAAAPLNIPPDAGREAAIQAQITGRVPASEVVLLDVDGAKVLALFKPQSASEPRGIAILLHGIDAGADSPGLMETMRRGLTRHGWSTLSVQMPVLPAGSPREAWGGIVEASGKRLQAAIAHAKSQQQSNIVVVAMDVSAVAALNTVPDNKDVKGIAALRLDFADGLNPPADPVPAMARLKLPLLDLYGGLGDEKTRRLAVDRANAARNANLESYSAAALPGFNDNLDGDPTIVVGRIAGWARRLELDTASPAAGGDATAPAASPNPTAAPATP